MPGPVLEIEEELVNITPPPVFSWLERLNDWVIGLVEMPGGMLILRIVTAAHMPAFQANTQMDPGVTHFQAFLTPSGAGCDLSYLVKMMTLFCHISLSPFKYFYACFCSTNSPSLYSIYSSLQWQVGTWTDFRFALQRRGGRM
jgi:hypothetical protein